MDLREVCRTCLCRSEDMFPLFEEDGGVPSFFARSSVVDVVNLFTEIMISRTDGFPEQICTTCINEVKLAYAFKLKCESSESTLYQLKESNGTLYLDGITNIPENDSTKEDVTDNDMTVTLCNEFSDDLQPVDRHRLHAFESTFDQTGVKQEVVNTKYNEIEDTMQDVSQNVEPIISESASSCVKEEFQIHDYGQIAITKSIMAFRNFTYEGNDDEEIDDEYKYSNYVPDEEPDETINLLPCSACPEVFRNRALLRIHIVDYHTDEKMCILCNKEYECNMWKHSETHLPSEMECFKSDGKFYTKSTKAEIECNVCFKVCNGNYDLIRHKRIHTGEKPFVCSICGMAFRRKDKLKSHMSSHSEDRPFQCKLCPSTFKRKDSLTSHTKIVHDLSGMNKEFKCVICSKAFKLKDKLKTHMNVHSDIRPFICAMCPFTFKRKDSLDRHIETKHGVQYMQKDININPVVVRPFQENMFSCEVCSKTFSQSNKLKSHMITHTDARPFQCTLCETSFKRKDNLNRHMKKHVKIEAN